MEHRQFRTSTDTSRFETAATNEVEVSPRRPGAKDDWLAKSDPSGYIPPQRYRSGAAFRRVAVWLITAAVASMVLVQMVMVLLRSGAVLTPAVLLAPLVAGTVAGWVTAAIRREKSARFGYAACIAVATAAVVFTALALLL